MVISILAPARGATGMRRKGREVYEISILAPARGATHLWHERSEPCKFQFSPLREGRPALRDF